MKREEVLELAQKVSKQVRAELEANEAKVTQLASEMGEVKFLEAVEEWLWKRMVERPKEDHTRFARAGKAINDLIGWYYGEEVDDEPKGMTGLGK